MKTCRIKEKLAREIATMNGQPNSLSPTWAPNEGERLLIPEKRDILSAELRHHHAKRHEGEHAALAKKMWEALTDAMKVFILSNSDAFFQHLRQFWLGNPAWNHPPE